MENLKLAGHLVGHFLATLDGHSFVRGFVHSLEHIAFIIHREDITEGAVANALEVDELVLLLREIGGSKVRL